MNHQTSFEIIWAPIGNILHVVRNALPSQPWNRLAITISAKIFDNIFSYFVALYGLVVGLRVKLLGGGDDVLTKKIDGDYLIAAGVLMILSGLIWKLSELILFIHIPFVIQENTSKGRYLESVKEGASNANLVELAFADHIQYWENRNEGSDTSTIRKLIFSGLIFSSILCVLSILALAISSQQLLMGLIRIRS